MRDQWQGSCIIETRDDDRVNKAGGSGDVEKLIDFKGWSKILKVTVKKIKVSKKFRGSSSISILMSFVNV